MQVMNSLIHSQINSMLTAQERKQVYIDLLEHINNPELSEFKNSNAYGICFILRTIMKSGFFKTSFILVKNGIGEAELLAQNLPELEEEKPRDEKGAEKLYQHTSYWWKPGDMEPRINALKNALEKVERLISNS